MSSIRGGTFRGRARGNQPTSTHNGSTSRAPPSTYRGRGTSSIRSRGVSAPRGAFAQPTRGHNAIASRGRGAARDDRKHQYPKPMVAASGRAMESGMGRSISGGSLKEREEQLNTFRKKEKDYAIANGLMTDPDKQVKVSEAITIVGTCQDMCPEHERVLRMSRNEVWDAEKDANGNPDEFRMVKKFKRSDAGAEAQQPSDLRPPEVLRRTCNYLFDDLLATNTLAEVHHFIWDRTRGIRNDFSIQQLTKLEDLQIAIECYERIARFHIVSLHQLASHTNPYPQYDSQQEREQLDRTLLSLMQHYDDTRGRTDLTNEAEFRAYTVIFQLRDPIPDLEDRVQSWPRNVYDDYRVRTALQVYAAACSIKYPAGPDSPIPPVIARQDWETFWSLIHSRKVSYLLGCVSEVYFMLVREMVLGALVRSSRVGKIQGVLQPVTDWTIDELWNLFNFDEEEELRAFFARWGLEFKKLPNSDEEYLDIRNLAGRLLPSGKQGPPQLKSSLVEHKRHGRTLLAVINGLDVRQAREAGMVVDERPKEGAEELADIAEIGDAEEAQDSPSDEDELFVRESKPEKKSVQQDEGFSKLSAPSTFGKPPLFNFRQSSGGGGFGAPSQPSASNPFAPKPATEPVQEISTEKKPVFNFLTPPGVTVVKPTPSASPFAPSTTPATQGENSRNILGFPNNQRSVEVPRALEPGSTIPPSDASSRQPNGPNASASNFFTAQEQPMVSGKLGPPTLQASPKVPTSDLQESTNKGENPFSFAGASSLSTKPSAKPTGETGSSGTQSQLELGMPSLQQQSPSASPTNGQPHHTNQNATITNPGSQSPTRRPSNFQDTKPKKPSPLANSFTANEDSNASVTQPKTSIPVTQKLERNLYSSKNSDLLKPVEPPIKSVLPPTLAPPPPSFDDITARLAEEIFLCPRNGILKQYLEYHVKHAVAEAQEKVLEERIDARLAKLRAITIRRKWYQAWLRNVSKIKSDNRRKQQRARRERRLTGREPESWQVTSRRGPANSKSIDPSQKRRAVDALFRKTHEQMDAEGGLQVAVGSKRTASMHASDTSQDGRGHKRLKSADRISDRRRIWEQSPPRDQSGADVLKRSSFLGFSLAPDAPNRASTTKSTYFRMKALGLASPRSTADANQLRNAKRPRSESLDFRDMVSSASRPGSSSALSSTPEQHPDYALMRAPSVSSARSKTNDDDDALFARLRAAREALKDGEVFLKDEVAKEEELRRSLSNSLSSNESPSMVRARAEARLRASKGPSDFGTSASRHDVPAYRLRQSRFLSREEQACAVERAHELRALRKPQGLSRPESKLGLPEETPAQHEYGSSHNSENLEETPPLRGTGDSIEFSSNLPLSASAAKPFASGVSHNPAQMTRPSSQHSVIGAGSAAMEPREPRKPSPSRNPFSQSSSFAPPVPSQNPFLKAAASKQSQQRIPSVPAVQSSQSHTIASSHINDALSHTFGPLLTSSPLTQATSHDSATPSQPNSYMQSHAASEAISVLSEDDEDLSGGPNGQEEYFANLACTDGSANAWGRDNPHSFTGDSETELSQSAYTYANANAFAALSDQADQSDEVDDRGSEHMQHRHSKSKDGGGIVSESYLFSEDDVAESEEVYGDGDTPSGNHNLSEDYSADDDSQSQNPSRGQHYYDDEEVEADEEGYSDDYEDGRSDDDEIEDEDEDEDEDDSDTHAKFAPLNHVYNRRVQASQPVKNQALQGVGGTEEEAIELSD